MADVRFEQATRIYPGTDVPAVDALDLLIEDGEFMVLVGPSLVVRPAGSPPIVGAALLALDGIGADASTQARLREALGSAVERNGGGDEVDTDGYLEGHSG